MTRSSSSTVRVELVLALVLVVSSCTHSTTPRRALEPALQAGSADLPYVWLEDLHSDTVQEWTERRTTKTREHFAALPVYESLVAEIRAARQASRFVLRPGVRPPARRTGPYADRFLEGRVWLRQPAEAYERGANEWERVLDLDSLSRAEGGRYAFRYARESVECLPPAYQRCLLHLARDGRSRIVDLREFDAGRKAFVAGGFELREAQTSAFWRDANSVYVTTKPMGWADSALIWRRGEPLDSAEVLFTADPADRGLRFERRGSHLLLLHARHQHDIDYYLVRDDALMRLPVPSDAREIAFVDGRMVVQLRSGWKPAGEAFPSGSLVGTGLDELLEGGRDFDLIMRSSRDLVVDEIWTTRTLVIVRALADLKLRLFELAHRDGHWVRRRIDIPESGRVEVLIPSPELDVYYIGHEDFLTPRTGRIRKASGEVEIGAEATPAFPSDQYAVDQWYATSADGTRVPYFVVRQRDTSLDGKNPVIISGYGGNGYSWLPWYLMRYGPTWLSRGGVYVHANIRGGNEFGFEWHDAVRREKRQRAFDDFQAVARDLVDRKVTSPGRIGIMGGSNGGILVSMSFIQQPELYGAVLSLSGVLELHRCSQLSGDPPVGERGDGQDPRDWAYMQHYSPFHNLREGQPYPALLMLANRVDDVVHPCHSRKFTSKLEDLGYDDVFLYETETGGHGKRYSPEEEAMIVGFFLRYLHPDYR